MVNTHTHNGYGDGMDLELRLRHGYCFVAKCFVLQKTPGVVHIYIYEDLCQRVFFSMQCAESLRKWKRNYADTMVIYFL